jgi:hypothetical protein
LQVTGAKLTALAAGHLRVKGPATFQNLEIRESADFQNAALETLEFNGIKWPAKGENRKLDGLTYTALTVDKQDNFPGCLQLVAESAFNPQNYGQLEDCCKRRGHLDWADQAFISMKDRELAQRAWWHPGRWFIKVFWGWLAGYGRKPLHILWASLAIVFIGAVLFNPEHLEGYTPYTKKYRLYLLRFLISLDQFLPALDMQLANKWKARETPFPIWAYFSLEQALGWILIPIGLAAIYTQIK